MKAFGHKASIEFGTGMGSKFKPSPPTKRFGHPMAQKAFEMMLKENIYSEEEIIRIIETSAWYHELPRPQRKNRYGSDWRDYAIEQDTEEKE